MKGKKFVTWLLACSLCLGMAGEPAYAFSKAQQDRSIVEGQAFCWQDPMEEPAIQGQDLVGEALQEGSVGDSFQEDLVGEALQEGSVGDSLQEGLAGGTLQEDSVGEAFQEGSVGDSLQEGSIGDSLQEGSVEEPFQEGSAGGGFQEDSGESAEGGDYFPEQYAETEAGESLIAIDSARFPDPAFASYLSEAVDADKDGRLSAAEIAGTVSMDVSGLGIMDLRGIEIFTGLKSLDCSKNSLIELDLSSLPQLEQFLCEGNQRAAAVDAGGRFTLPFALPDSVSRIRSLQGAVWDEGYFIASGTEMSYVYDTGTEFSLAVTVSLEQSLQDISQATVGRIPNATYTGTAICPQITLTYQGEEIPPSEYSIAYKNNVNAGTAQATVTGKGRFTGTKQVSFQILPKSIQKLSCSKIPKKTYTGKKIEPAVKLKDGSRQLKKNRDYTVTYKNNKQTGKATAKITGKGNYKGTIQRTFQILPRKVSAFKSGKRTDTSITLKWKKSASVTGYQVYQYQPKTKKYKKIKTLKAKSTSLTVKKLSPCTSYRFKIRAYKKSGKSMYYGAYSKVCKAQTKVSAPSMNVVSERKGQARISWGKVKKASGLELSYRKGKGGFQKVSSVSENSGNTLYMGKLQEGASYTFRIRAYRETGGKKDYSAYCQRTVTISSQGSALSGGNYSPGSVYGPSLSQAELNQVREKVQDFKDRYIDDTMSDYLKVKIAHDYLASVCSYAPSWAMNRANTAWGALVYGEAQCSGYARAMKALCDGIGIGCYYVHADANASNPSHQWNEVCVDGKWYIIDVQCNDSSGFYAVFLVSDNTFARTFGMSWDRNSVPACPEDYRP